MSNRFITLVSVLIALASLSLLAIGALDRHAPKSIHNTGKHDDLPLREAGQAGFAALIEIVENLEKDKNTDWSMVDIDSLRTHLQDMDHLMLDTDATKSIIDDLQIEFIVRGTAASTPSIHRMVPTHSRFIEQSRGWTIEPELNDYGVRLLVTVADEASLNRINALGFYGFMSLDSHHQAHHFQMAIGQLH